MQNNTTAVNLCQEISRLPGERASKVISAIDDVVLRAVKLVGENPWHFHDDYEETFFLVEGDFALEFEDRTVQLREGDFFVVPRGRKHRGKSALGAVLLRLEKQNRPDYSSR